MESQRKRLSAFLREVTRLLDTIEKADDKERLEILARIRSGAREMGLNELSRAAEAAQSTLKTPNAEQQIKGFINEARAFTASLAKLLGYSKQTSISFSDIAVSDQSDEEPNPDEQKVISILREAPPIRADINGLVKLVREAPEEDLPTEPTEVPALRHESSSDDEDEVFGAVYVLASLATATVTQAIKLLPEKHREKVGNAVSALRLLFERPLWEFTTPLLREAQELAKWVRRLAENLACRIVVEAEGEGVASQAVCGFLLDCAKNLLLAGLPLRDRPTPEPARLMISFTRQDGILLRLEGLASMRRMTVGLFVSELRYVLSALSGNVEREKEKVRIRLPEDVVALRGGLLRCGGVMCAIPLPTKPRIGKPKDNALILAANPKTAKLVEIRLHNNETYGIVVDEYMGERTLIARPGARLVVDPGERKVFPLVNPFTLEEDDWL